MTPTIHIPNTGHPWSTVYAVAAANISESWLLTGGLMVQLHAIMGGLTARPTIDADLLADLMADRRGIARLRGVLTARGFECVCSIESGPCERVESLQMSGRF